MLRGLPCEPAEFLGVLAKIRVKSTGGPKHILRQEFIHFASNSLAIEMRFDRGDLIYEVIIAQTLILGKSRTIYIYNCTHHFEIGSVAPTKGTHCPFKVILVLLQKVVLI